MLKREKQLTFRPERLIDIEEKDRERGQEGRKRIGKGAVRQENYKEKGQEGRNSGIHRWWWD